MKADIPVLGRHDHPQHSQFQEICGRICPISIHERRKAIALWFQKFLTTVNEERVEPFRIAALEDVKQKRETLRPI